MHTPLIQIQNIVKTYRDGTKTVNALKGVSMDIKAGTIFGLLGVNGAGKTTLSSILATLHPPTAGDILFKGRSIYSDIMSYRHKLGFCPQTQNLDMFLTVEQNLVFAGRYFLLDENTIKTRVAQLMDELELAQYAKFNVNELSGGNKQRVLIARALMHNPELVILDEPTVGLDPDIRKKLWNLIKGLKKRGVSIILTTHYLDEAEYLSDEVCVLHQGEVVLIESMASLKARHQERSLEDIFIKLIKEQPIKPR